MKTATSAMRLLVSMGLLALVCVGLTCADQQLGSQQQQQQQQHQPQQQQQQSQPQPQQLQPSGVNKLAAERQGRSVSGSSASSTNVIEHSSSKSRLEQEKRAVQEFLTTKNIFKSIVKLLFGNQDEVGATSRHVLGILGKVLDLLKNTFGQKSRSGTARTIRDSAEDAANAGVSMLQGYVKSVLATDEKCVQRYLCQASKEAVRDSRDLGFIISTAGGYMSSYLLEQSKPASFKKLFEATKKGQNMSEDCVKIYPDCPE